MMNFKNVLYLYLCELGKVQKSTATIKQNVHWN